MLVDLYQTRSQKISSDRVKPPANSTPVRHALLAEVMSVLIGAHALIPRDFDFVSDLVTFDIVGAWEPAKRKVSLSQCFRIASETSFPNCIHGTRGKCNCG